ncbi:MAG: RNA polymerase sigma factor [Acidimicrobiales bacterium]
MDPTEAKRAARFTDLYEAHYTKILAYCRRRLPLDMSGDAVAETFVAAWRRLDDLSDDPALWLYGLARGVVANQRRALARAARLRARVHGLASASVLSDGDNVDREGSLLAALERLSPAQQEALRLTAWEGLTATEAAVVAGCSAATFKVRTFRARQRIRQLLETDRRAVPVRAKRPRVRSVPPVIGASMKEGDRAS